MQSVNVLIEKFYTQVKQHFPCFLVTLLFTVPGPVAEQTDILNWKVFLLPASPLPISTLGTQKLWVCSGRHSGSPSGSRPRRGWLLGGHRAAVC